MCSRSGYATFSNTVIESNSAAPWNTMPIFWRTSSASSKVRSVMSSPSMQHAAAVGHEQAQDELEHRGLARCPTRRRRRSSRPALRRERDVLEDRLVEGEVHVLELDDLRFGGRARLDARLRPASSSPRSATVLGSRADRVAHASGSRAAASASPVVGLALGSAPLVRCRASSVVVGHATSTESRICVRK